ncbi:MAG: transposase family protein [Verrucomicrobia bacterium]|nr:transposase family protein [Verrucomicrobiota bacterium]
MKQVPGTTPHGRWPWERACIDHTKIDLRLLLDDGVPLDGSKPETLRAWLSVMIDGFSRKVLAFVLDFNPPSNKSCMLLLRECVRKHRHLPKMLVMDGGKEFKSNYFKSSFKSLMSKCLIISEYRPPRRPRFGAQIERWFGTANTQLFHQLLGNTKVICNVRQVTKAVDPSELAACTLEILHETLSEYCDAIYNGADHSSLNCSPNAKFKVGNTVHGDRLNRRFEYTEDFIKWMLPSTSKGFAKVTRDGIKVIDFYEH